MKKAPDPKIGGLNVVREAGFEPARPFGHWHLKPARLPFRHSRSPSRKARNNAQTREGSENKHSRAHYGYEIDTQPHWAPRGSEGGFLEPDQ